MKTFEELKNLNEDQLIALGAEELAAAVIMLTGDIAELEEELKNAVESKDNYYKWYNDQCASTYAVQKKLDSLKALIAVI